MSEQELREQLRAAYLEVGALRSRVSYLEQDARVAVARWLRGRVRDLDAENRRLLWMLGEGP